MEALFKQGSFEILTDDVASLKPREMNWLINRCGSVSYQSWKTSKKTTEEFVKMIYDKRHLSVIEHSWFLFFLKAFNDFQKKDIRLNLLDGNHLFCITKRPDGVIVSGNARMFTEAYIRNPTTTTATLLNYLRTQNQILFPIAPREDLVIPMIFQPNPVLKTKKEILTHRAMTVLFDNCSRGLTHEDVRSRNGHNKVVAYTQESTRYVDPTRKGGFKF